MPSLKNKSKTNLKSQYTVEYCAAAKKELVNLYVEQYGINME